MNCIAPAADIGPLVSRNSAREKLREALRLYVGRGRRYSVKELSNATGVRDRMIESALCDPDDPDYRPLTLENLASLCKFLGAPFASAFLELSGLGAFELMDGQPPLPRMLEPCKSPDKLTRDDHIRKAREHLNLAEGME
jgi:hypothetical protein